MFLADNILFYHHWESNLSITRVQPFKSSTLNIYSQVVPVQVGFFYCVYSIEEVH